jgi:uncharacterized protein YcbK (DUF882 family)
MNDKSEPAANSRRRFLAGLAAPAVMGLAGLLPGRAALAAIPERSLVLQSRELGETVRTVYYAEGDYMRTALGEIRHIFRDKHNDSEIDIDPQLLDTLWLIQRRLSPRGPLEVVCGYRSPQTNAMLRRTMSGVAANSFHMYGKAVDLRIPGCPLGTLHRLALNLEAGGVGYYPRSNFIHIDTGPLRNWGQTRSTRRRA